MTYLHFSPSKKMNRNYMLEACEFADLFIIQPFFLPEQRVEVSCLACQNSDFCQGDGTPREKEVLF